MKKKVWTIVLLAVAVGALGFGYTAYRAQRKLVTLDVRDMDVREVVRKMERQTWEDIFVHKDVSGKVTMNVRNMPLEGALEIVAEQTSSRWSLMYPLYSTKQSLGNFKKAVTGEVKAEDAGWKALRFGGFRMAGGFFGESSRNDNQLVTLKLEGKSLEAIAGAVSRFTRAQVVPEDGSLVTMSINFSDVPVADAVSQLAKKANRNWTKYYALQGSRFGPRGPGGAGGSDGQRREFARDGESNTNAPGTNDGGWFGRGPEMSEEARKRFEEQLSTLSPEERQKMEERRRQMEEMRKMSPEDREKKMREMAQSPEFQQRMQGRMMNGIKNTTPEQRVERDQRMNQMRKRWGR